MSTRDHRRAIVTGTTVTVQGTEARATFELARWAGENGSDRVVAEDNARLAALMAEAPAGLRDRGLEPIGYCEAFTDASARSLRRTPDLFTGQVVEVEPTGIGGEWRLVTIQPSADPYAIADNGGGR